MIQIKTMEALKADETLSDLFDYLTGQLELPEDGELLSLVGGDIFVAENDEDLATIVEMSGMSVHPSEVDAWEVSEFFDGYVMLAEITNDAGGNAFVIFDSVAEAEWPTSTQS